MHERIKFSCLNFRHPIKNDTKIVKNKNNLLFCSDIECKNLNLLTKILLHKENEKDYHTNSLGFRCRN